MPIDTSIYNPLMQPMRSATQYAADYAAQDDQATARQINRLQLQTAQQAVADDNALRNYLAGGADLRTAEGQRGLWKAAPGKAGAVIKSNFDALKTQGEIAKDAAQAGHYTAQTGELEFKTRIAKADQAIKDISGFADPASAVANLQAHIQAGDIDPQRGQAMLQQLQSLKPGEFPAWQMGMLRNIMSAKDQLESKRLHFQTTNTGGKTIIQGLDQYNGQPVSSQTFTNTVSPDSVLAASTSRANTRDTIASQDRREAGHVTYQTDANGNLVAVPTRLAPGQAPRALGVVDAGGQPVPGKDSGLNGDQSKALLFGSRMQTADKVLSELSAQGVERQGNWKSVSESIPMVGGALGSLTNWTQSPQQQQVEQAQRDFINAVLRRESGAAISPTEFDSARKQYFPQIGDSDPVKAQKARNRQLATQGLLAEVPQGKRNSLISGSTQPQTLQPGAIDFGSLR